MLPTINGQTNDYPLHSKRKRSVFWDGRIHPTLFYFYFPCSFKIFCSENPKATAPPVGSLLNGTLSLDHLASLIPPVQTSAQAIPVLSGCWIKPAGYLANLSY